MASKPFRLSILRHWTASSSAAMKTNPLQFQAHQQIQKKLHQCYGAAVSIRSFSSPSDDSGNKEEHFGTVKFYLRNKHYGFIQPDPSSSIDRDVFVHRNEISSEVPPFKNPTNPFLLKGERVKFSAVEKEGKDQIMATDVTYEDGTWVPIFRPAYFERTVRRVKSKFGDKVYDILDSGTASYDDIQLAFEKAKKEIQNVSQKVDQYQHSADRDEHGIPTHDSDHRSTGGEEDGYDDPEGWQQDESEATSTDKRER